MKRHKKPAKDPTLEEQIEREIDKDVKEVKREWRHFLKFKDENKILFLSFVILMCAVVVINTVYIINHNRKQTAIINSKTIYVSDIGRVLVSQQIGKNAAEIIKITNVTELDKTDYAFPLESGQTMLILTVSITNRTNKTQQLIPVNQFYVRTESGQYSPLHASMYVTNPLGFQELAAGQTAKGQVSFSVSKAEARPLLYVDTGWGKVVPVVYDVLH